MGVGISRVHTSSFTRTGFGARNTSDYHEPSNSHWELVGLDNNYVTEMCSGFEAGSYLRRIVFVHHSTLGLRVIKKKKVGGSRWLDTRSEGRERGRHATG